MFFKEAGTRATATIYTLPPFAVQFLEEGDLERKKKTRERVEERRGEERRERLDVLRIRAVSAGSPNGGINSP